MMTDTGAASRGWPGLRLALAVGLLTMVADQASKWAVLEHVMTPPRLIEVTPFFNLTLGFNRGVSFGFLGDGAAGPWLLSALAVAIIVALALWAWRSASRAEAAALGAIIGGAVGNVIDRVRQGAVTDFLDLHAFGWHWPTFNLADVGISGGVGLLLVHGWIQRRRAPEADETREAAP